MDELVDISVQESDLKKIYSDRRTDTAISPVPLALKHFPTLLKEYPLEPNDLEQEEEPQQHEPKLHADRMIQIFLDDESHLVKAKVLFGF